MPSTERSDDQAIHLLPRQRDAVVIERHRDQPNPNRPIANRDHRTVSETGQQGRPPLHDITKRPTIRRRERADAGRMRLANPARSMDLISENNKTALITSGGTGRDLNRGKQIGRPIRAGQCGVAHGASDHDRRRTGIANVQQIGRFLDGVGTLRDHHAIRRPPSDLVGKRIQVSEAHRSARHLPKIHHLHGDAGVREPRHSPQQLLRRQRVRHAAPTSPRPHRNRATKPEQNHPTTAHAHSPGMRGTRPGSQAPPTKPPAHHHHQTQPASRTRPPTQGRHQHPDHQDRSPPARTQPPTQAPGTNRLKQTGDQNTALASLSCSALILAISCGRWCRVKGGAAIAKRRDAGAPLTRRHRPSRQSKDRGSAERHSQTTRRQTPTKQTDAGHGPPTSSLFDHEQTND